MPAPTMNDWELLRDYAERKSERAFELLVNRYVDLVYSTALRCVANAHLAEEVSQAVFLIVIKAVEGRGKMRVIDRKAQGVGQADHLGRTVRTRKQKENRKEKKGQPANHCEIDGGVGQKG